MAGLAMRPIRYVLLDEVDRYLPSAGTEGDPVSLAVKRSTTWNRAIVAAPDSESGRKAKSGLQQLTSTPPATLPSGHPPVR